jgi:hypothetical protein
MNQCARLKMAVYLGASAYRCAVCQRVFARRRRLHPVNLCLDYQMWLEEFRRFLPAAC